MKKKLLKNVIAGALLAATIFGSTAFASSGWSQNKGKWIYTKADGVLAKGWDSIGGAWYYFNSDNTMATDWISSGNAWYYLQSSGAMKTGWVLDGTHWYYLNNDGSMKTGWLNYKGKSYYLNHNGDMAVNTTTPDGYYVDANGVWDGKPKAVSGGADSSTVVKFPDKNLEKVIRSHINKPTGDILKGDVEQISDLMADGSDISNISGIENLTNIKYLDLGNNQISNIDSLKGLTNLVSLWLMNNKISNIDALSGLTNLNALNMSYNQITNLDAVKGLKNLTVLDLSNNKISNIDSLSGLNNLKTLYLYPNEITDYSPVSSYYNNLKNKDFLLDKPTEIFIQSVNAVNGEITANFNYYVPVPDMPDISDYAITQIIGNGIPTRIAFTSKITDSSDKTVKFIIPIVPAEAADQSVVYGVSYKGKNIVYSEPFVVKGKTESSEAVTFPDKSLIMAVRAVINKPTGDILKSDVEKITELNSIGTSISDIRGIENLVNLQRLDLSGNQISDISALKGLVNLQNLSLNDNPISDISSLMGLTNLKMLYFQNDYVTDADEQALKDALPNCTIEFFRNVYDPYAWAPGIKSQFEDSILKNGYVDSISNIIYKKDGIYNDNQGYYAVFTIVNGQEVYVVSVNAKTGYYHG